ncbi:hypothetical protein N39L_35350 [Limnospira platensis NIES-39]|nr:hypothetical protein N39L_35350 [Arthrospira platensis NIES-39]
MGMVRSVFLIFNQGVEVPTRRLFQVFQPYFMPERLALLSDIIALVKVVRTQLGERNPWHHRENQTAHVQWRMRAFNHDQYFSILLRSGE